MNQRLVQHAIIALVVVLSGCDHSVAYSYQSPQYGPATSGNDVRLTYNPDQDDWPVWTEDQSAVMYAFVDSSAADPIQYGHRCMGLLPAGGGTRLWQWCDNSSTERDSLSSFPAFALGSDGRLLYLEDFGSRQQSTITPDASVLWLADTAAPQLRRRMATLPFTLGDSTVSWLADLQWTGPNTFVGLAQHFLAGAHGSFIDSVFFGEWVVQGTITATGATFQPIAGTAGATGYSLAEGGSTVVFTRRNDLNLMTVPIDGGTPTVVVQVTDRPDVQLTGVSCRESACVVALGPLVLWAIYPDTISAHIGPGAFELRRTSLATGSSDLLYQTTQGVLACPLLSASGDVIAMVGDVFGHLQTFSTSVSDLHLYPGLMAQ